MSPQGGGGGHSHTPCMLTHTRPRAAGDRRSLSAAPAGRAPGVRDMAAVVRRNEQLVLEVAELRAEQSRLRKENTQLLSHAKVSAVCACTQLAHCPATRRPASVTYPSTLCTGTAATGPRPVCGRGLDAPPGAGVDQRK